MNDFNNCVRASLKLQGFFGLESEMLLDWARGRGAQSNEADLAVLELLHLNGATSDNLNDAWLDIYKKMELKGSLREKKTAFWIDHMASFPPEVIVGWTGKEFCNHE